MPKSTLIKKANTCADCDCREISEDMQSYYCILHKCNIKINDWCKHYTSKEEKQETNNERY